MDSPGPNFGPFGPPSNSNESRRWARFGGSEKSAKSSLTAEQSADLVKTSKAKYFFLPPLSKLYFLAHIDRKFLSFLGVSSEILNGP